MILWFRNLSGDSQRFLLSVVSVALTQMAAGLEDQDGRPPMFGALVLGSWMGPLSPSVLFIHMESLDFFTRRLRIAKEWKQQLQCLIKLRTWTSTELLFPHSIAQVKSKANWYSKGEKNRFQFLTWGVACMHRHRRNCYSPLCQLLITPPRIWISRWHHFVVWNQEYSCSFIIIIHSVYIETMLNTIPTYPRLIF